MSKSAFYRTFVLAVVVSAFPVMSAVGDPKLTTSTSQLTTDSIWLGDSTSFSFTVTNEGDEELKIERITATCGCTKPKIEKDVLAPEETTTVTATFNSKGKHAGKSRVTINIYSNDPARPKASVGVVVPISVLLEADPASGLSARTFTRGEKLTLKTKIKVNVDEKIELVAGDCNPDNFDVTLKPVEEGKVYELTATTKEPMDGKTIYSQFTVKTVSDEYPDVPFVLNVVFQDRVVLTSRAIYAGSKNRRPRTVRFQYFGDDEFKITSASCDRDDVTIDLKEAVKTPERTANSRAGSRSRRYLPTQPSWTQAIDIKLPETDNFGDDAVVIVTTNDPDYPKFEIPITADRERFRKILMPNFKTTTTGKGSARQVRASDPKDKIEIDKARQKVLQAIEKANGDTKPTPEGEKKDAAESPVIEFDPPVWDFGTVFYGAPLEKEIVVKNSGTAPLNIVSIRKSCGCTQAAVKEKEIPPGGSTIMTVGYDSYKGVVKVNQTVSLTTNDPKNTKVQFKIKGIVNPLFTFEPQNVPRIMIGDLDPETSITKTFIIKTAIEKDVVLSMPKQVSRYGADVYDFQLKEVAKGRHYELTVTTKPPIKKGIYNPVLYLDTDYPEAKKLKLTVYGRLVDPIRLNTERQFITPDSDKPLSRTVWLYYKNTEDLKIDSVTCSNPDAKTTVLPTPKRTGTDVGSYRINVTFANTLNMPTEGWTLNVLTNAQDPQFKNLSMRFLPKRVRTMTSNGAQRVRAHPQR